MAQPSENPTVGILLFDDVEVLDFAGPYEVFSTARDASGQPLLRVVTVAAQRQVRCVGGLRVVADATFAECPPLDVLVVPGGPGAREVTDEQKVLIPFIQQESRQAALTTSVCTGAFLLGRAQLLAGRKATTHALRLERFRDEFPDVEVVAAKIVDEGEIITAAGVSSGIDLALHVVERLFGAEVRRRSAAGLDGPWE